jgi:SecD/SecF fusion protein
VDRGFSRAAVTILDSQLTTLLAAVILYQFGTGPVQGYATALSIGVVCSIFTSIVVSRAQFDFLLRRRWLSKLTMITLMKPDTHIRFLDRRILAIGLSTAMILVGMVMFTLRGSANFGVDFTSGTNMIVSLDAGRTIEVGQVRTKLAEAGFRDVVVQEYEESGAQNQSRFLLRLTEVSAPSQALDTMANPSAGDQTISGRVQSALAVLCGSPEDGSKVALDRVETIGPAVGAELKRDAVAANVYSWVFMIIYLWFRFELRYGVAAVVALVHDVLVTLCLFALTGREITMPVVAAMLTIIGYSVNDTIVIFDRVRENTRLYRGRDLSYLGILDLSINQTMSRTLLTSFTVLLVVVVMFFFGGEVLHDFAFALIVGVFVGTYSTVFIAGPVAYYWQRLQTHHKALTGGGVTPKKRLA